MSTRHVFSMHKPALVWALTVLFFCPLASAQFFHVPTVDVFAGYSYERFDAKPLGFSGQQNLNGWNFEAALPHIYRGLGAVADVSGHYNHEFSVYNFMIGPQYTVEVKNLRLFVNGMYGKTRNRLGLPGSTSLEPSNLARTIAVGGGIDVPLGGRMSWRAVQGDYLFGTNFGQSQRNVRLSTGLVFRFRNH
jgi:hypothetical protein